MGLVDQTLGTHLEDTDAVSGSWLPHGPVLAGIVIVTQRMPDFSICVSFPALFVTLSNK